MKIINILNFQGDAVAVEKILAQDKKMINIVTRDGQSALHLGKLCFEKHSLPSWNFNGFIGHQYPGVIKSLISCPQCDINIANAQVSLFCTFYNWTKKTH